MPLRAFEPQTGTFLGIRKERTDVNSQATAQTAASNANRLATGEPDSIDALFERSNQSVAAPTNATTASSVA